MDWCRNVGENHKTFFGGVGSGNAKHRTSWEQTSVLSKQNIGTLPSRSPMFLISRRAARFRKIRFIRDILCLQEKTKPGINPLHSMQDVSCWIL